MRAKRFFMFIGMVCILSFPLFALAASPDITKINGLVLSGSSIDIFGTTFGSKAQAAPIRYDDFESGTTVGHLITDDLTWWSREPNKTASISSDYQRPNSSKNGKFNLPSNQSIPQGLIYKQKIGFALTGKIYVNYWTRFNWGTSSNSPTNYFQIKTLSLNHDVTSLPNDTPAISMFNYAYSGYPNSGGYTKSYWSNYWYGGGSGPTMYLKADGTDSNLLNIVGWYNISLQVNMGTPGTANGNSKTWVSAVEATSLPSFSRIYGVNFLSNVMILGDASNTNRYIDDIRLGWYRGETTTGETNIYYDNIYIDNSWARVEIGDKETYDTCTHREIQIPTAWATDHVVIKVNLGSFNTGDNVYLYVVDENGVVNTQGNKVTVGETYSALSKPKTPYGNVDNK